MSDLNKKFNINYGENGFTINILEKTKITDEELVNLLRDEDITRIQELQLSKEKLKPEGFEYAPKSAEQYRKLLQEENDMKQMQYLKSVISYNKDGTINILPLKKVFCNDISGKGDKLNFDQAQKLGRNNEGGYSVMTDYDNEEEKMQSDWYKIVNLFNKYGKNKGDTKEGMYILSYMIGYNRYWTATPCKNKTYSRNDPGDARLRNLISGSVGKEEENVRFHSLVCGRKDMIV